MTRRQRHVAVFFACLAVGVTLSLLLWTNRNDDAYITYRHAQNLLAGRGFVFNPGEPVLATTAPFHGLIIAAMGLVGRDLVANAMAISAASTVALAYLAYRILDHAGESAAGVIAAATIVFMRLTYEVAPLESVLVVALCWGSLRAQQLGRRWLLALFGGLAMGVRADAALWVGLLLTADLVLRRRPKQVLKTAAMASLVVAPWFLLAWSYYGDPLPSTASAKTGWEGHLWTFVERLWERGFSQLFATTGTAVVATALALVGAVTVFRREHLAALRVVPVWLVVYIVAYSALRIFWAHHWYYFPLVVAAAVLMAVGAIEAARFAAARIAPATALRLTLPAWIIFAVALGANILDVMDFRRRIPREFFIGGRDLMYRQVATWLREHTERGTKVAVTEPGTIAYYADRPMIDMMGLATPQAGVEMKRRGTRAVSAGWTIEHFDPDIFVLSWPKDRPFPGDLPQAPHYKLQQAFAAPGVDVGLLLYAKAPL